MNVFKSRRGAIRGGFLVSGTGANNGRDCGLALPHALQ